MVPEAPTLKQRMAIETMITLAFNARKQEKLARRLEGREATEAMRLTTQNWAEFHRRLDDFEASLVPKKVKEPKPPPAPPEAKPPSAEPKPALAKAAPPSLDRHLEAVRQKRSTSR